MATLALSSEQLKQYIGRRQVSTDVVTAGPANLLRLTFARDESELRAGDPLPPGWHILYFLPRFSSGELRPDGSPAETGVVPEMPLPRRMFAGERLRFHRPLRIGEAIRRETELSDISVKTGGTEALGQVSNRGDRGGDHLVARDQVEDGLVRRDVASGIAST